MKHRNTLFFATGLSAIGLLAGLFSPAYGKCVKKNPLFGFDVYVNDKHCVQKKNKKKAVRKKAATSQSPNTTAQRKSRPSIDTKKVSAPKPEKRILQLQTMLTEAGYNPGPVDGFDGPMTRKAAAEFNIANDLPKKASIGSTNAVLRAHLAPKPDHRILKMQKRLSKLGYYSGPVDGFDGPETRKAAAEFNVENDLPEKASIGSTNAVLLDQLTPKPDRRNREMQQLLSTLGYYSGPVDGLNGPETRKAAAEFNIANGLPKKAATPSTLAVLRHLNGNHGTFAMAGTSRAFNDDVQIREMQNLLTGLGYKPGPANGVDGLETRQALGHFLRSMSLPPTTSTANSLVLLHRASGN